MATNFIRYSDYFLFLYIYFLNELYFPFVFPSPHFLLVKAGWDPVAVTPDVGGNLGCKQLAEK
jgi:hypothetical protein